MKRLKHPGAVMGVFALGLEATGVNFTDASKEAMATCLRARSRFSSYEEYDSCIFV